MFNIEQFENEIKLKDISKEKCIALAVRTTMRLLPLISLQRNVASGEKREVFWLWQTAKENNLLFLLRACAYCYEFNASIDINTSDSFNKPQPRSYKALHKLKRI